MSLKTQIVRLVTGICLLIAPYALAEPSPALALAEIKALATQGNATDVPVLLEIAARGQGDAAIAAADALLRIEDQETAAARAAGDRAPVDPVLDVLAEAARVGPKAQRIAAIFAISGRRATDAETTVVFLAEDPDQEVALAAIAALARLVHDGDSLLDAITLLNDANDPERRAALERCIVEAMRGLPPREGNAGDLVTAYRVARRPDMKESLVRMIEALGDQAAMDALAALRSNGTAH